MSKQGQLSRGEKWIYLMEKEKLMEKDITEVMQKDMDTYNESTSKDKPKPKKEVKDNVK